MAMLMMLRRMERGDLTAHGFRSTFRTWTAERTNFPREIAEAALAHVSRRQDRGSVSARRSARQTPPPDGAWAAFTETKPAKATGNVTSLRQ